MNAEDSRLEDGNSLSSPPPNLLLKLTCCVLGRLARASKASLEIACVWSPSVRGQDIKLVWIDYWIHPLSSLVSPAAVITLI